MSTTFPIDIYSVPEDITQLPLTGSDQALVIGATYDLQNIGSHAVYWAHGETGVIPPAAFHTLMPGASVVIPVIAGVATWFKTSQPNLRSRLAVTQRTEAENGLVSRGQKFSLADTEVLAVDCRFAAGPVAYGISADGTGVSITRAIALTEYPAAGDYLTPGSNATTTNKTLIHGREEGPVSWMKFTAAGGACIVWIAAYGDLEAYDGTETISAKTDFDLGDQTIVAGHKHILHRQVALQAFDYNNLDVVALSAASGTTASATVAIDSQTGDVIVTGVAAGSSTITVTATTPDADTATATFDVTVVANAAPVAISTATAISLHVGHTFEVDGFGLFRDEDDFNRFTITAASDNNKTTVAVRDSRHVVMTGASAGSSTVTVTATDSGANTATYDITVAVSATSSDVVTHSDNYPRVYFDTIESDAEVIDLEDLLTLRAPGDTTFADAVSSNPAIATVSETADTITITPRGVGITYVHKRATQVTGTTTTIHDIAIPVEVGNRAPVKTGTFPVIQFRPGKYGTYSPFRLNMTNYANDPDGESLHYTTQVLGGSSSSVTVTVTGHTIVIGPYNGPNKHGTMAIRAIDPHGAYVQQIFSWSTV